MKNTSFSTVGCYLIFFAVLLSACHKNGDLKVGKTTFENTNVSKTNNVPFTDTATLNAIAQNKKYVDYNIARKLAVIRMAMSINDQMEWNGTKLSERPVTIYDITGRPKYYEFIVEKKDGTPIGTITATAKKEMGSSIAYILPYVREYEYFTAKGGGYDMVAAQYPNNILLGAVSKEAITFAPPKPIQPDPGFPVRPNPAFPPIIPDPGFTPIILINPITFQPVNADNLFTEDAQGVISAINVMPQEVLDSLHSDKSTLINAVRERDMQNQQDAQTFWAMTDTLNMAIAGLSDDSINALINSAKSMFTTSDQYVIPAFSNPAIQNTRWEGWCGPSAMAIVYRAYYNSYKGFYLPLAGESGFPINNNNPTNPYSVRGGGNGRVMDLSGITGRYYFNGNPTIAEQSVDRNWVREQSNIVDGGLYYDIANISQMFHVRESKGDNVGPTLPWDLNKALQITSDFNLSIFPAPVSFLTPVSLNPITPTHSFLRSAKTPVLCWTDWFSHYQIAIGSEIDYWNWTLVVKILFLKFKIQVISIPTSRWLLLQDNGFQTGDHNYRPYWKNDTWSLEWQYPIMKK